MVGLGGIIDGTAGDENPTQKVRGAMIALEAHEAGQGLALGLLLGQVHHRTEVLGGGLVIKAHVGIAVRPAGLMGHGSLTGKQGMDQADGLLVGLESGIPYYGKGGCDRILLHIRAVDQTVKVSAAAAQRLDGKQPQLVADIR